MYLAFSANIELKSTDICTIKQGRIKKREYIKMSKAAFQILNDLK